MSTENQKKPGEVETTGHSWDGIEEYNNPLPRWWLWTFYACILFAIGYTLLFPAWPLVKGATPGILGYSTRGKVAEEIQHFEDLNADLVSKLESVELADISPDANPDLYNYAVQGGRAVFNTFCAQCHGSGAAGVQGKGYPNLLDNDWLWGGTIEDIHYTVSHGIRNETDEDARYSQMPAFGEILAPEEIDQVVQYVRKLSGQEHDAALAGAGETVFLDNCSACHGEDGTGDRMQGAPNLTDVIWLYGGSEETIRYTVENARFGIMPPKGGAPLTEAQVRAVATYVHQLGGGE
jgi:cytochrome c oxidase cbb3-type subunit 3